MFVLDKDIKAGQAVVTAANPDGKKLPIYKGASLVANAGVPYVVPETDNYAAYENVVRGQDPDSAAIFAFGVMETLSIESGTDGHWLHWNRMPDGTLINQRPIAFAIASDVSAVYAPYAGSGSTTNIEDEYESKWASSTTSSFPFTKKTNASLFGGSYSGGILRVGYKGLNYTTKVDPSWEYGRYMLPTIDSWLIPKLPAGQSAPYLLVDYFGLGYAGSNSTVAILRSDPSKYGGISGFAHTMITEGQGASFACNFEFLVLKPTGQTSQFTKIESDLGTLTEPTQFVAQTTAVGAYSASIDGVIRDGVISAISGGAQVDLASVWDDLSLGSHECVVRSRLNGYETGQKISFVKSTASVGFTSKPASSTEMPVTCRLVDNCTVPTGATITREVTNNGNDENPSWESYSGTRHEFANAAKTSGQWGLAARITIDNSHGNAEAKISQGIAMGVTYKGE